MIHILINKTRASQTNELLLYMSSNAPLEVNQFSLVMILGVVSSLA